MDTSGKIYHFDRDYGLTTPLFDHFQLYQLGELYGEAGYSIDDHQQWCYEITYIESGSGTCFSNDATFSVHAGDIIVSNKTCQHRMHADANSRLRFLYLGFDVEDADTKASAQVKEILHWFDTTNEPCISDRFGVGDLMHKLLQEFYCEYAGFHEAVASYLKLIVLLTYRNGHLTSIPSTLKNENEESMGAAVYRIIRYVDDHLCEIDSIRSIANDLNYNYSYLSYLFKKRTGTTLQKYIVNKKMERALVLLTERGQTVSQVAATLGYKSVQSFSKVFSNVYGKSPSTYLKQYQKEDDT